MAYDLAGGSTDSIAWANTTVDFAAGPATFAFWWRRDDTPTTNEILMSVGNAADNASILIYNAGTTQRFYFFVPDSGSPTFMQAASNALTTLTTWVHVCVVWDGGLTAANQKIYFDAAAQTQSGSTNGAGSVLEKQGTIRLGDPGPTHAIASGDGKIAFPGIWTAALSLSEVESLAKGYSPRMVRRDALKWAPDLTGNGVDPVSGLVGTFTGTTAYANPRIILPRRRVWTPKAGAAASLPTLSASTYVTGSLTSTGWRPQITAS